MSKITSVIDKHRKYWAQKTFHDKLIIISSVIFLSVVAGLILIHGTFFTPDEFFAVAFVVVLIMGQARQFLWDWTPAILLLLIYEYLRSIIPLINHHVHYFLMPRFDLFIFGQIPSYFLQQALFNSNHLQWYDYLSVVLYLMHFIFPMITAFVFWLTDEYYFKEYILGMVGLSYITFLTYLIFPAAPPWLGAQAGVIPPVQHLTDAIVAHLFPYVSLPTVYRYFGANLYAAVPSLHAAYPVFTALYIFKKVPKLGPLLLLYVLAVAFALMYLGEHYFFDIILGATYALAVYAAIQRIRSRIHAKKLPELALKSR